MNIAVFWHDNHQEHVVSIQAGQKYPYYSIYQSTILPNNQLSILCTTNFTLTQQVVASQSVKASALCMMPDDFNDNYQHHNENGLDIDKAIWDQLVELSKDVLVESTELSRMRGAGEIK